MALKSETQREYRLCSMRDPALDRAQVDVMLEYVETRDEGVLTAPNGDGKPKGLLDGAEPTWFLCEPLTAQARLSCESKTDEVYRCWWAFRYAVKAIEGLDGEQVAVETQKSGIPGVKYITDSSMEELVKRVGAGVVDEIGAAILEKAALNPAQKKGFSQSPLSRRRR